jgi:hypothetical protein
VKGPPLCLCRVCAAVTGVAPDGCPVTVTGPWHQPPPPHTHTHITHHCHSHSCQVRPLEEAFKFGSFFTPLLHESDFEAKPCVLLLGQYSTGV